MNPSLPSSFAMNKTVGQIGFFRLGAETGLIEGKLTSNQMNSVKEKKKGPYVASCQ